MEQRYHDADEEKFVSEKVDFNAYFNEFGKMVLEAFPDLESDFEAAVGASYDDFEAIHQLKEELIPPKEKHEIPDVDEEGFKILCKNPPPEAISRLKSLKLYFQRTPDHQRDVKKKLCYIAEIDLEDTIQEDKEKYEENVDLFPLGFYVFTVRVYLPVLHSKYTQACRAKDLQVGQEFMCLSSNFLDDLRDRIACCNDFQPIDGDISENLSRKTSLRAMDVHQSAMFYIANDFYIDRRLPDNLDYSEAIRKWGDGEGFKFGDVIDMENTRFADLKPFRLGYPYLYLHQGTCEHLIIFTDARLIHPRDPMSSQKYPFLVGFASLNGKFCYSCYVKTARFLVVDSDRLPEDGAFMCTHCLESYNYIEGRKIGNFRVFGYVARAAFL